MNGSYEDFLKSLGIPHEFMYFNSPVKSASQAEMLSGEKNIIKSIVVFSGETSILCIVPGDRKVGLEKLGARLATPEEVERETGFRPGAVPPILEKKLKCIIDSSLKGKEYVVGGGGSDTALVKLRLSDIEEKMSATFQDISL